MAEVNQLKEIWESFAFTRLIRTFRLSVGPPKILIALIGIIAICIVGWVMDIITTKTGAHLSTLPKIEPVVASIAEYSTPSEWPIYEDKEKTFLVLEEFSHSRGVFSTLWNFTSARFHVAIVSLLKWQITDMLFNLWLCLVSLLWAIKFHPVYSVIFLTFVIVVSSFCGGAICRCAALEFARREKPGFTEAFKFGWEKLGGFIAAPLIPIGIMVGAGACVTAFSALGNIPVVGKIIIALGIGVALVFGLFISLFLVGTVLGCHIMFPAIAYEGTNGFDAISRSFAYVYAHLWAVTFYGLIASFYGTISYLFMRFFAFLLLIITYSLISIGIFDIENNVDVLSRIWLRPEFFNLIRENTEITMTSVETAASSIIHIAVLLVVALLTAFIVSFYFCSCTIIYALMREKVDSISTSRIYIHLDKARHE